MRKTRVSAERRPAVSLFSLLLSTSLVLAYLWWGRQLFDHAQWLVATYVSIILIVALNHIFHGDSPRELGLRLDNLGSAARWFGVPTLALTLLVSLAGLVYGTFHSLSWQSIGIYLLWASLQQHLLQNFLVKRSREVLYPFLSLRPRILQYASVLLASVLFAAFHLPNLVLVALTFAGALFWCSLFTRVPSLPVAILSQTILTTTLLLFFKTGPLNQFEVGRAGHRYEYYGGGVQVAAGKDSTGQPFIAAVPGADQEKQPRVRIFTPEGHLLTEWLAFEDLDFSAVIAAGDVDLQPGDEVVVSPGPGRSNPALVRVFSLNGRQLLEIRPTNLDFGYGAWVSVACSRIYVTPGPAPGAPQRVLEFSGSGEFQRQWDFPDLGLENSIRATALCTGEGNLGEVAPDRLLLWGTDISVNPSTVFLSDLEGRLVGQFETLTTTFGVNLDLLRPGDGEPAVVVAPGPLRGYPPLVGAFDLKGNRLWQFSPFDDPANHGSNVTAIDVDGDGRDEIILGEGVGEGRPSTIRLFSSERQLVRSWEAFPE